MSVGRRSFPEDYLFTIFSLENPSNGHRGSGAWRRHEVSERLRTTGTRNGDAVPNGMIAERPSGPRGGRDNPVHNFPGDHKGGPAAAPRNGAVPMVNLAVAAEGL